MKLKCNKAEDRDVLVVILARNGYTVRQTKEKEAGKSAFTFFVEVVENA